MDHPGNSRNIAIPLLSIAILILIVQNFLLVRKTGQYSTKIKELMEETEYYIQQIHERDTLGAFEALTVDSSTILIDPAARQTNTVYFFFTTFCPACKKNMSNWNDLMDDLSLVKVQVVGICPDSLFRLSEFRARVPIRFPVFSIATDFGKLKKYKLTHFPSTILVGPLGVVRKIWNGVLNDDKKKEILRSVI